MSTRCQVLVTQTGLNWDETSLLYHHCDGYPENILPLLAKAKELAGNGWEAGRAGKVASFLCAIDPGQFEPESGEKLHPDIEYLYILEARNENSLADVKWFVKIYQPIDVFWDKPSLKTMTCTQKEMEVQEAADATGVTP